MALCDAFQRTTEGRPLEAIENARLPRQPPWTRLQEAMEGRRDSERKGFGLASCKLRVKVY
jgi:hypothetical protein